MKVGKILYLDNTTGKNRYIYAFEEGAKSVLAIGNLRTDGTNGQTRFVNAGSTSMIVDSSFVYTPRQIQGDNGLKVDFVDTRNTGANFSIRRNGTEFLRLDETNDNITCSKEIVAGGGIKNNTYNSDNASNVYFKMSDLNRIELLSAHTVLNNEVRFVNTANNSFCRHQLGNHHDAYLSGGNGNTFHINYYSHGDVMLGTDQSTDPDPKPTISINKYSSNSGNAFEVEGDSVFYGDISTNTGKSVKTNTINSNGNNDLVLKRNSVEYMRLQGSDTTIRMNYSLVLTNTYTDNHYPTQYGVDTVFNGSNVGDTAYLEYFRFNHASESCDFNVPIDNSGTAITGNIIDTTVSDERLKTNIKDVESNFTECVKNAKVKTFEYTDEKYKNNDKYGFIAQQLLENLPKEFKNIVKETKNKKEEGEAYLSINYMQLSIILWGCLQEEMNKREHIESRLFELEDIVREMRGKGKGEKVTMRAVAKLVGHMELEKR